MEINFNADDFARWIGEICGSVPTVNENEYIYTFPKRYKIDLTLDKKKVNGIVDRLRDFSIVDETIISNGYIFETLVREERSPNKSLVRYISDKPVRDPINKITYQLMRPSDEFTLFLISKAASISSARDLFN